MKLALFDIDDTLIDGDSEVLWCEYLTYRGLYDMSGIEEFMQQYREERFDFEAFMHFQLRPLAELDTRFLEEQRANFLEHTLLPRIPAAMRARVEEHRARGHSVVAISAAHDFLAIPIAAHFRMDAGLCTRTEQRAGRYTGRVEGTPCFGPGKLTSLDDWLATRDLTWSSVEESWFYSDSHHDLPLLERVDHPIAVRPTPRLRARARASNWEILGNQDAS